MYEYFCTLNTLIFICFNGAEKLFSLHQDNLVSFGHRIAEKHFFCSTRDTLRRSRALIYSVIMGLANRIRDLGVMSSFWGIFGGCG